MSSSAEPESNPLSLSEALASGAGWASGISNVGDRPKLVAIGNFDGVHLGHQRVLGAAAERARASGLMASVLTFDPHPVEVLVGAQVEKLTSIPRRADLVRRVDAGLLLVVEPFTRALAALSPAQFAKEFLVEKLNAKQVMVGENFRFGKGRAGDLSVLKQLGRELGFEAFAEELLSDDAQPISSSRIREAIREGEVGRAGAWLSRPHAITGRVVKGDQKGRTIGFPTANLAEVAELLPSFGVYSAWVDDMSEGEPGRALASAVVNIGVRPTVSGSQELRVEAHLLKGVEGASADIISSEKKLSGAPFQADLYGKVLRLHLTSKLRSERRFESFEQLRAQIAVDAQEAERLLKAASELIV